MLERRLMPGRRGRPRKLELDIADSGEWAMTTSMSKIDSDPIFLLLLVDKGVSLPKGDLKAYTILDANILTCPARRGARGRMRPTEIGPV